MKDVKSLNIIERWNHAKDKSSLAVPIGIDENSNLLVLDIHESKQGPNVLVFGSTGSGKSEFFMSYILGLTKIT